MEYKVTVLHINGFGKETVYRGENRVAALLAARNASKQAEAKRVTVWEMHPLRAREGGLPRFRQEMAARYERGKRVPLQ